MVGRRERRGAGGKSFLLLLSLLTLFLFVFSFFLSFFLSFSLSFFSLFLSFFLSSPHPFLSFSLFFFPPFLPCLSKEWKERKIAVNECVGSLKNRKEESDNSQQSLIIRFVLLCLRFFCFCFVVVFVFVFFFPIFVGFFVLIESFFFFFFTVI